MLWMKQDFFLNTSKESGIPPHITYQRFNYRNWQLLSDKAIKIEGFYK